MSSTSIGVFLQIGDCFGFLSHIHAFTCSHLTLQPLDSHPLFLSEAMAALGAGEQLTTRAAEIRVRGRYLGLLEWVAFAALEKIRVEMLFGCHVIDVCGIFAPALCLGNESDRVCRAAAVKVGPNGKLLSAVKASGACHPDINHYVIGLEASGPGPSHEAGGAFSDCAHRCALRANWVLRATVRDGDCALDAMVSGLGVDRTSASRQCLRTRIADF